MKDSMIELTSNSKCFTSFMMLALQACDVFNLENTEQYDKKRSALHVTHKDDKEFDDFMVVYCI